MHPMITSEPYSISVISAFLSAKCKCWLGDLVQKAFAAVLDGNLMWRIEIPSTG